MLVIRKQRLLHRPCRRKIPGLAVAAHRLGHSSHVVVDAQKISQTLGEDADEIGVTLGNRVCKCRVADFAHELVERERMQVEVIDLPDGPRRAVPILLTFPVESHAEEGSRCDNRHVWPLLAEHLQSGDGTRALLNLVEKHERSTVTGIGSRRRADDGKQAIRFEASRESPFHILVLQEHDVGDGIVAIRPKSKDEPCLSHLTGAVDNERLAMGSVAPSEELYHGVAIHPRPRFWRIPKSAFTLLWRKPKSVSTNLWQKPKSAFAIMTKAQSESARSICYMIWNRQRQGGGYGAIVR